MLKVLEQILTNRYLESPEHVKYTEAVKEMQIETLHELQRLALKMPDQLLVVLTPNTNLAALIKNRKFMTN